MLFEGQIHFPRSPIGMLSAEILSSLLGRIATIFLHRPTSNTSAKDFRIERSIGSIPFLFCAILSDSMIHLIEMFPDIDPTLIAYIFCQYNYNCENTVNYILGMRYCSRWPSIDEQGRSGVSKFKVPALLLSLISSCYANCRRSITTFQATRLLLYSLSIFCSIVSCSIRTNKILLKQRFRFNKSSAKRLAIIPNNRHLVCFCHRLSVTILLVVLMVTEQLTITKAIITARITILTERIASRSWRSVRFIYKLLSPTTVKVSILWASTTKRRYLHHLSS